MKNIIFNIGVVLVMFGVALVAMATTTTKGLEISVLIIAIMTLRVMNHVETVERRKAVEMEA